MRFLLIWILVVALHAPLLAMEPQKLKVGDKAPALDIEHWIHDDNEKIKPVTEFERGIVYVIEFWGTWCPPCIAMMPHLAETQTRYGYERLRIVSVSTEEREVVEKFLARPAPGADQTYRQLTRVYSLTADPDRSVYRDYMDASSSIGVPMAFVVGKTGVVEWAGRPTEMAQPLRQVIDGTWNREEFTAAFDRNQQLMAEVRRLSMLRQKHPKDPEFVLGEIEKAIESFHDDDGVQIQILHTLRIRALLESGRVADVESEIRVLLTKGEFHHISAAATVLVQLAAPHSDIDVKPLAALTAKKLELMELPKTVTEMPVEMQRVAKAQKQAMLVRLLVLAGQDARALALAKTAVKDASDAQTKQMAEAVLKQLQANMHD